MLNVEQVLLQRGAHRLEVGPLALAPGQRVTLIGPSGGGKSTLLRALVGLEPAARVRGLRWLGQDLTDAPAHQRPFGWLPQDLGLWPQLDALAHLAFARSRGRHARADDRDAELLAQVGLAGRARALPGQLSGGERQRLALARVLALQAPWAVLDEPFSHLDPVMAHELSALFTSLSAALGIGLIQVSHQLQRVDPGDPFWVLEAGTLVQSGPWQALQENPATPWIERFVALQR